MVRTQRLRCTWSGLWVFTLLPFSLYGCSSSPKVVSPTRTSLLRSPPTAAIGPVKSLDAAVIPSKELQFLTDPKENVLIAKRLQQVVAACVRKQGFKFYEQTIGGKPLLDLTIALPVSLGDRQSMAKVGFGLSSILSDDAGLQNRPKSAESPENTYIDSLTEKAQLERGKVVIDCYSMAIEGEFGNSSLSNLASRDVAGEAIKAILSDRRYSADLLLWSKCLAKQGIKARSELALKNSIERRIRESKGDKVTVLGDGSLSVVIGTDIISDLVGKRARFDRMRQFELETIAAAVRCADVSIKLTAEIVRSEVLTNIANGIP
jgi:hypothetical protein